MKIRQLHINRFGHFNECDLVFPGDGLQVIYGPNEAGKTTLLEFLRGLLFDFPARTPYDFGGQGEMAGVATLNLRDTREVELRRRKGNKDKVAVKLAGQPTDLDDAGWLKLLDHADRGLFESVFAFGLDQLSQGEATLKHESLKSALFGGSLGGTSSPDKVAVELTRQADDLFKKGGSKPAINALLAELKKLAKEIKDRSLRPEKFHEAEAAVTKASERAEALDQQVRLLRSEHSKIEKLVRAWPKWWELKQQRGERLGLVTPVGLTVDARQRYASIIEKLQAAESEYTKFETEVVKTGRDLAALKLDPGAVSNRAEIKSCLELKQSVHEARRDLPERRRQRDDTRRQIDRELAELRPGWGHDDLRAFAVDLATRAEIDRLSIDRQDRTTARTKVMANRDADAANLARAKEELDKLGPQRDVAALVAVLDDAADFAADRKQRDATRNEIAKIDRQLATRLRKLTPPLLERMPAPHELPVPRVETVAQLDADFAQARQKLDAATASLEQDEHERSDIADKLADATSNRAVPSLEDRDAARARRDAGWTLIRRQFVEGGQSPDEVEAWLGEARRMGTPARPALSGDATEATDAIDAAKGRTGKSAHPPGDARWVEAYEQSVRDADDIADRIYDNADAVARREALRRQLEALSNRIEQKETRRAELECQRDELQAKWLALWQPCGFEPLAPDAMLRWLDDREAVCETIAKRDELTGEVERLGERTALFEQRLRSACHATGEDPAVLLASAEQTVEEAKEEQRRSKELQREIKRLTTQLAKYDDELTTLAKREAESQAEWRAVLSRLNLPADWETELARVVIERLSATRVKLDSLPNEEERIAAMQARVDEFDRRVRPLCETLAPLLLREPPELAIEKLDQQLERGAKAQDNFEQLSKLATSSRERRDAVEASRTALLRDRDAAFAAAGVATEAAFLEAVTRCERIARLDADIERLSREIDLLRAGDDCDEFEQSMTGSELADLQGEQRERAGKLQAHEQLKREADEAVGAARKELAHLDGSGEVAILTGELSRKRSLLAAEVDRYMPLIYARHLLNAAVSRFEKENQPEMIATVSRLLGQMTGGKYIEFDRSGGGKQNVLIRRADGVERTPDQLSTGTREQLYLAIRLAYVLHYPLDIYALVGSANAEEIAANIVALNTPLTMQEMDYLDLRADAPA